MPETIEPIDWQAVARLAMQQRDLLARRTFDLEIDLSLARARIAELEAGGKGLLDEEQ